MDRDGHAAPSWPLRGDFTQAKSYVSKSWLTLHMEEVMAQECCPAIEFECDGCGVWQFAEDTLEAGEYLK